MEDASEHGVLNVENENGEVTVAINALQMIDSELRISINGETKTEKLKMQPMEVFTTVLRANADDSIEVSVAGTEIDYSNNLEAKIIKRPFYPDKNLKVSESEQLLYEGSEALEYREYELAHSKLSELIKLDPSHQAALVKLAELEYRRTNYDIALAHANTVLRMDTYHAGANYIAGITYRAQNDPTNALESLGWAARDIKYRSVAYAQMAEVYLKEKNHKRAKMYASKALDFNRYNINAKEVRLLSYRELKEQDNYDTELKAILKLDPMNFYVKTLAELGSDALPIQNEFKEESVLGIALRNFELGFYDDAESIFSKAADSPKNNLWKAYLSKENKPTESNKLLKQLENAEVDFVFPYRRETIPVLEWAISKNSNWKLKYYLAQNYISVGLKEKGIQILKDLGSTPTSDIFYRFRAVMIDANSFENKSKDHQMALDINTKDWKVWEENIQFYLKHKKYDKAYGLSKKGYRNFKNNYNIGLAHAKALLNTGRFDYVLKVMQSIQVLPYEHASESREIYTRAHMGVALQLIQKRSFDKAIGILNSSKEWPENIGVGKPYQPDERAQNFMLAFAFSEIGNNEKANSLFEEVAAYTKKHIDNNSFNHLYGMLALKIAKGQKVSDDFIVNLLKPYVTANKKSKLALDVFESAQSKLEHLKKENEMPEDVWKIAEWAVKN